MQFNTFIYILAFLPITVIGYFLINKFNYVAAKIFLVVASAFFYIYAGIRSFKWLIISMIINYIFVLVLKNRKQKAILWLGIILDIALLFYFKYTNFAITSINEFLHKDITALSLILPVGISFFTFQQISYLVDSYRGETSDNTLLDYLIYVTFFPKILMGPITKQADLLSQFHDESKRKLSSENLICGIQMFTIGLFKKVIIADTFAKAVSWAWNIGDFGQITAMDTLLVMIAYTFQIYFDFSGYSDMSIAAAKMLNIYLPMNFDSPYKAYSIRDFWKRWHISLTKFLTEYLYIPLGGSKNGKFKTYLNTMIVFLISGIWHGANWTFILWGILHGVFSVFDRLTDRFRKNVHLGLQWMSTFFVVNILWFLFRADSILEWKNAIFHIFSFQNTAISDGLINSFILPETSFLIRVFHLGTVNKQVRGLWMLLFYFMAFVLCLGFENAYRSKHKKNIFTAVFYALLFIFILTCIGTESVFVYFNF